MEVYVKFKHSESKKTHSSGSCIRAWTFTRPIHDGTRRGSNHDPATLVNRRKELSRPVAPRPTGGHPSSPAARTLLLQKVCSLFPLPLVLAIWGHGLGAARRLAGWGSGISRRRRAAGTG